MTKRVIRSSLTSLRVRADRLAWRLWPGLLSPPPSRGKVTPLRLDQLDRTPLPRVPHVLVGIGLVAMLASCGWANRSVAWPARGAFLCIENTTSEPISVSAEDAYGRQIVIAQKIYPQSHALVRWPFIAAVGRMVAGRRAMGRSPVDALYTTREFHPWDADYWRWTITPSSFGETVPEGRCS